MAFGITTFAETSFSSLPFNTHFSPIGQQASTSLGNITITANGAITIQTGPEIALDVNVGNVTIGLASFLDITGQGLVISQGEEIISASATTATTGQQIVSSVNSVTTQAGSTISITGELANIVANTISISEGSGIILTGQQILVHVSVLSSTIGSQNLSVAAFTFISIPFAVIIPVPVTETLLKLEFNCCPFITAFPPCATVIELTTVLAN